MSAVSIWREPTATQYRTFFAAWSGWVLDAFDFTIFLLVMPHIEAEFGVKNVATTASIALTLLARLVGGYVAGKAADRWGRRLPLLLSIVWFALCDGAVALAPSFTAVLVLRTLFGFGMGAEWTSGTTLAMENWPARSRGIASGVLQGSWAIGYLLAAAVSAFVVPRFGWRGLFVVAALPALLVLPMRFAIPESDEWKSARGKTERLATLREVFRKYPTLLGRTLWASFAMAAGFGAYYAITGLYPSMLVAEHGMDAAAVAKLGIVMAELVAVISERQGFGQISRQRRELAKMLGEVFQSEGFGLFLVDIAAFAEGESGGLDRIVKFRSQF